MGGDEAGSGRALAATRRSPFLRPSGTSKSFPYFMLEDSDSQRGYMDLLKSNDYKLTKSLCLLSVPPESDLDTGFH